MGRAKQRMELIRNERARYVTFQKRKKGLKKKAYELQTLCDVKVGLIVYGPQMVDDRPAEPEIWPQNPDDIQYLIDSYKNQSNEDRIRRTLNVTNFFMDRNQKIEDALVKLRAKNDQAMYSTWDDRYGSLSKEQLGEFECVLEGKLQEVKARIAFTQLQTTQNQCYSVQGLFGSTRNLHLEGIHEQQPQPQPPISYRNGHEVDIPSHYPSNQIHQGFHHVDVNSMANDHMMTMMMPMKNMNHYVSTTQSDGMGSSSNFPCNPVLDRPIYYDSMRSGMMLDNILYDNPSPGLMSYCSPNMQTMSPYLQYLKMASDSSDMDKYYNNASEFEMKGHK